MERRETEQGNEIGILAIGTLREEEEEAVTLLMDERKLIPRGD